MPGYELIGNEELLAIQEIFTKSNGVLFAHGFDARRQGIFRVRQFERDVADYFKCQYVTAVTSGTAAGLIALKALNIGPGDEVITQAFTFVATVEAIVECGATPIVVDCDETLNMCPQALEKAITPRTKCIMPVHMLGSAARMDEILAVAKAHHLPVVEDACEAVGGQYYGQYLGTLGDIGFFSLDFGKTITTGEGGLLLTNQQSYYRHITQYHDHGHQNLPNVSRAEDTAIISGFNYRMTEMQAAVGLVQLQRLNFILERNRTHKQRIKEALKSRYASQIKFRTLVDEQGDAADTLIFFLPTVTIADEVVRDLATQQIATKNIPSAMNWHFAGCWPQLWRHHPMYRDSYREAWRNTAHLLKRAIALSILVNISEQEMEKFIQTIVHVLDKHITKSKLYA